MTLLYHDGFDKAADFNSRWTGTKTGLTASAANTPWGVGRALSCPNQATSVAIKRSFTASAHPIVGCNYHRPTSTQTGQTMIFSLAGDGGVTGHLAICMGSTATNPGAIQVYRSATNTDTVSTTLLAQTANGVFPPDQWHYIEVEATIDSTVGIVKVYLDGNPTPIINFTGNTKNGGTLASIDTVTLSVYTTNHSGPYLVDDLYIANNQGSANNAPLGPVRAYTLDPNAAGADSGLTITGSANHFANVSDANAATWNASPTSGIRDNYALPDLPADAATVFGVQLVFTGQNSDAGAGSIKPVVRSGGSNFYDATLTLSATAALTVGSMRETDPATSAAWTVAAVNALQIGAEVA